MWPTCAASTDLDACTKIPECIWSDGKELIPDHEFCAPMEITDDVTLIEKCIKANVAADCNYGCQWRKPTTTPTTPTTGPTDPTTGPTDPTGPYTPNVPAGEIQLFTKEFCHPSEIDVGKFEKEFSECLPKSATECTGSCAWSSGKSLIPDKDYCFPAVMTDDIQSIAACVQSPTDATCVTPCKWRRGKQAPTDIPTDVPTNDIVDLTGPMFSKKFCHPVMSQDVKITDESAKMCLTQTDA
jgi:hypothetical protein